MSKSLVAAVLSPFVVSTLVARAQSPSPPKPHDAEQRILVRCKEVARIAASQTRIEKVTSGSLVRTYTLVPGLQLWRVPDVGKAVAVLKTEACVAYAEPDHVVRIDRTPDDPQYSKLWGMGRIRAPAAWDFTTQSSRPIAVLDTGVDYRHPDLAANMWRNPGEIPNNRRDDDGNGFVDDVFGIDLVNRDGDPVDDHGHGSHVAGTIGAVGNNRLGVAGVNWRCRIMALKFLDHQGRGRTSDAIAALEYAVKHGAVVSNHSYGSPFSSRSFRDATIRAKGHILVVAAGNSGRDADRSPSYPAAYDTDNILSVAALDWSDRLASFSNYGKKSVDLAAPGVAIYSTHRSGGYATLSGTSMAAPHVAGVVALLLDAYPSRGTSFAIDRVLASVRKVPSMQSKMVAGGALDAGAAIAELAAVGDYDGDGKADRALVNLASGQWFVTSSRTGARGVPGIPWGWKWGGMHRSHELAPGDYDGDGKTDRAIVDRAIGAWYIISSKTGSLGVPAIPWGWRWGGMHRGHRLAIGDYDGDGKADRAIEDPAISAWYVISSKHGTLGVPGIPWGWRWRGAGPHLTLALGDYDGDGKTDRALVYRPGGLWYVISSKTGNAGVPGIPWGWKWVGTGSHLDLALADYDGDGKTDRAHTWKPGGQWWVISSRTGNAGVPGMPWGWKWPRLTGAQVLAVADYNGDGRADPAGYSFAGGQWEVRGDSLSYYGTGCGLPGRVPSLRVEPQVIGRSQDVVVTGALPNQAAFLIRGRGNTGFRLDALGAIGCTLYPNFDELHVRIVDRTGTATVRRQFPNDPRLVGIVFFHQAIVADPRVATPWKISSTRACRAIVE